MGAGSQVGEAVRDTFPERARRRDLACEVATEDDHPVADRLDGLAIYFSTR